MHSMLRDLRIQKHRLVFDNNSNAPRVSKLKKAGIDYSRCLAAAAAGRRADIRTTVPGSQGSGIDFERSDPTVVAPSFSSRI